MTVLERHRWSCCRTRSGRTDWVRSNDVVGRTIVLNGTAFTVVGVAPERFAGLMRRSRPICGCRPPRMRCSGRCSSEAERQNRSSPLIGRLKPGVDLARAQADLDTIGRQLRQDAGEPAREQAAVTVYPGTALHPEFMQPLTVMLGGLMAVMALVLGIVCVNVANLVLARAAGRGPELAIRQSLGAPRRRLIRQLLTENGILAAAGVLGGLAIAFWGTQALSAVHLPTPIPGRDRCVARLARVSVHRADRRRRDPGLRGRAGLRRDQGRSRRSGQGTALGPGPRQPAALDVPDRAGGDVGPAARSRGPVHSQREERHLDRPRLRPHQRGRRLARPRDARLFAGEGTGVSPHPARSPQRRRRTRRRDAGGHRPGDALEPDHRSAARIRSGAGPRRTVAPTAGLRQQRGTGPLPHAADRAARRPGFHAMRTRPPRRVSRSSTRPSPGSSGRASPPSDAGSGHAAKPTATGSSRSSASSATAST